MCTSILIYFTQKFTRPKILYCQVIWQVYVHRVRMLQDKFDHISVSIDECNMKCSLSMNVLLVKIQSGFVSILEKPFYHFKLSHLNVTLSWTLRTCFSKAVIVLNISSQKPHTNGFFSLRLLSLWLFKFLFNFELVDFDGIILATVFKLSSSRERGKKVQYLKKDQYIWSN